MKPETLNILNKLSDTQLAQIYCEINTWNFPEILKEINPVVYEKYNAQTVYINVLKKNSCELSDFFNNELSPINEHIRNCIGQRAVSRHWNTVYRIDEGKMNDEQFNEWWNSKNNLYNK